MDKIFRKILNETGFSNNRYMANANSQKHRMVNSAHYSQNGVNFSNLVNVSCQSKVELKSVIPSKITSFRTEQGS